MKCDILPHPERHQGHAARAATVLHKSNHDELVRPKKGGFLKHELVQVVAPAGISVLMHGLRAEKQLMLGF